MIKKIVAITLAIFFLAVIIIVGLGLFSGSNQPTNQFTSTNPLASSSPSRSGSAGGVGGSQITNNQSPTTNNQSQITKIEVAKHNTPTNCWLIINNKIYDVSQYLEFNLHPGENATITPYCGKEATMAFDTKDRSNPRTHSTNANSMLADYYVGDLAI
jgi:cytochrome b involved in lipid metabolism